MLDNKFCEGKDYLMRKTAVIMTACFVASSVLCACGNEMNKETSDAGNNAALESINNEIAEDFNTEQAATEDESTNEYVDIAIGTTGYDMIGKVVDKLPEDEYYNHYNVKGDNDEIYICNYNGEGELEEGTWVYMYMVDDGMYNIEVAYDIKDAASQTGEVIYTNENGVEVKDLAVVLVGDTYNFQIIFANPTSSDQKFDLTKLKVENYDGTEINVFAVNETPKTVGAGLEYSQNAYTISAPGNLSLGDEVSFYYDGVFIYKSVVTEF